MTCGAWCICSGEGALAFTRRIASLRSPSRPPQPRPLGLELGELPPRPSAPCPHALLVAALSGIQGLRGNTLACGLDPGLALDERRAPSSRPSQRPGDAVSCDRGLHSKAAATSPSTHRRTSSCNSAALRTSVWRAPGHEDASRPNVCSLRQCS